MPTNQIIFLSCCAAVFVAGAVWLLQRRFLQRLLGPLLLYDLIRTTRRGRYILLRCIYAGLLLVALFAVYASWSARPGELHLVLFTEGTLPPTQLQRFAESFFSAFIGVQFVATILFTPVYVAGSIAEERERRTLELLLATDLNSREIVLGKLVSRLANLTLLILTGLPILCLMQFLGGVQPDLIFAGFAVTLLTMLSLGGLSMVVSVHCKRPLDAVFYTYVWSGLALCFWCLPGFSPMFMMAATTASSTNPTNPDVLLALVMVYGMCNGSIALVCCIEAMENLRGEALQPGLMPSGPYVNKPVETTKATVIQRPVQPRPPRAPLPDEQALLWKELHVDSDFGSTEFGRTFGGCIGVAAVAPLVVLAIAIFLRLTLPDPSYVTSAAHWLVRATAMYVFGLLFLTICLSAAGRVCRERDQRTLESLLATPWEYEHILFVKWQASLYGRQRLARYLALLGVLGAVSGGLHIFSSLLLFIATAVFATFSASLGLFFSVASRTTLRANIFTLIVIVLLSGGPWLLGWNDWDHVSPPGILWQLAFPHDAFQDNGSGKLTQSLVAVCAALVAYVAAAWLLWKLACVFLTRSKGPKPLRSPPKTPQAV